MAKPYAPPELLDPSPLTRSEPQPSDPAPVCWACKGTGHGPCQDHLEACEVCGGFPPEPSQPSDYDVEMPT